jgi:hypothetical protein
MVIFLQIGKIPPTINIVTKDKANNRYRCFLNYKPQPNQEYHLSHLTSLGQKKMHLLPHYHQCHSWNFGLHKVSLENCIKYVKDPSLIWKGKQFEDKMFPYKDRSKNIISCLIKLIKKIVNEISKEYKWERRIRYSLQTKQQDKNQQNKAKRSLEFIYMPIKETPIKKHRNHKKNLKSEMFTPSKEKTCYLLQKKDSKHARLIAAYIFC